ncbi:citrate lyase subunit beta [Moniliophthora roreri]|nr:citrate lyase subunit beta [Moniliophthora roreri]
MFARYLQCTTATITGIRRFSTALDDATLRRSYLYVPSSSDRMLEKSTSVNSDVIIYDLEDSVAPSAKDKANARDKLKAFLGGTNLPSTDKIAVRVNDVSTPFFTQDVTSILSLPAVQTVVLPKVHSAQDLHYASRHIAQVFKQNPRETPVRIVSSVESAKAMWNLGEIAGWKSEYEQVEGGILNCADTSIIRTKSRQELLYTRSQIAVAAKAFGLEAIDMVCIHYKDLEYLKDECQDGRRLGFTGKQAIHPNQVETILSTFVPTSEEITRAAKILHQMETAHALEKGAIGLDGEMIDAPMIKQAESIIKVAKAANLKIPSFD